MMGESGAHLPLPEDLIAFSQGGLPGINRLKSKCLSRFLHHHLWTQFDDLQEWILHLSQRFQEGGRVLHAETDQRHCTIQSREEIPGEKIIMKHEMMKDERDRTAMNVTKMQLSSEDLAYVPKDLREPREPSE